MDKHRTVKEKKEKKKGEGKYSHKIGFSDYIELFCFFFLAKNRFFLANAERKGHS